MSVSDLQKVKDFKIENSFGKIEFIGETDVTDIDLADIVTIT